MSTTKTTKKGDSYANYPWSSPEEYARLSRQYRLFGAELKTFLEKEAKKKELPLPRIKKALRHRRKHLSVKERG